MERKRFIFRWKLGSIEVEPTWDFSEEGAWMRALHYCRPASMKRTAVKKVIAFLREHGEVIVQGESNG